MQKQGRRAVFTSLLGGALQGGASAFAGGLFGGAGGVNLQGQATPLTNNAAFVRNM
ncbi:hypothetical protein D3C84_1030700 [compost metagenome]